MRADLISPDRVRQLLAVAGKYGPIGAGGETKGCVEGAIGSAHNAALYALDTDYYEDEDEDHDDEDIEEPKPDPLNVAAYLLKYLAQNHCFGDGNKRVAWLAMLEVLEVGAFVTVSADQGEAASFVIDVATGETESVDDIVRWLAARLVGVSDTSD